MFPPPWLCCAARRVLIISQPQSVLCLARTCWPLWCRFYAPNPNAFLTPANYEPTVSLPGSSPTSRTELWPLTDPTSETIIKLPLLYPLSSRSFRLDNTNAGYSSNPDLFSGWLHAETSSHCLDSLELCGSTDEIPLRNSHPSTRLFWSSWRCV